MLISKPRDRLLLISVTFVVPFTYLIAESPILTSLSTRQSDRNALKHCTRSPC